MSRILSGIKKLSGNLNGTPSVEEYHALQVLKKKIENYEWELSGKNFSLNRNYAFTKLAITMSNADIPMPYTNENDCLSSTLIFSEDSNDRIEIFAIFPPKKNATVGLCVYELKKADSLDEWGKNYGSLYGKQKLAQCDWCDPAPRRNEELEKIISAIKSQMKLSFKKAEDGLYVLSIPTVNSLAEFKKQVMPKLKGIHEILLKS